jgi:hypothetical protein
MGSGKEGDAAVVFVQLPGSWGEDEYMQHDVMAVPITSPKGLGWGCARTLYVKEKTTFYKDFRLHVVALLAQLRPRWLRWCLSSVSFTTSVRQLLISVSSRSSQQLEAMPKTKRRNQ